MKHEPKYCPLCGEAFECKVGDVINCQCNAVKVAPMTYQFLAGTDLDCLCKNCLVIIDTLVTQAATTPTVLTKP